MRFGKLLLVLPLLALLATSCGPRRHCGAGGHDGPCKGGGPGAMMTTACGADACLYGSQCFSSGAMRSNDGVCQECNAGKWTNATGCSAPAHQCCAHGCGKGKGGKGGGKMPCMKGGR